MPIITDPAGSGSYLDIFVTIVKNIFINSKDPDIFPKISIDHRCRGYR